MAIDVNGARIAASGGVMTTSTALTWTTDENTPDPKFERILGEMLCVRPLELKSNKITTKTGFSLELPDTVKERYDQLLAIGRVIGVGELAGRRPNVSKVKVGDYVLFPKHSGDRTIYNGVKVIFMYDDVPFAVVNPEDVDLSI